MYCFRATMRASSRLLTSSPSAALFRRPIISATSAAAFSSSSSVAATAAAARYLSTGSSIPLLLPPSRPSSSSSSSSRRTMMSAAAPPRLLSSIESQMAKAQETIAELKKFGDVPVGGATVKTVLGGMRGTPLLLCETSSVDPEKGVAYRGRPLLEVLRQLPTPTKYTAAERAQCTPPPMAEGLLWLLLTGQIPTADEAESLRRCLVARMHSRLPIHVAAAINAFPPFAHPMTQLIAGVTAMQTQSEFARRYAEGRLRKQDYWAPVLEDALTLVAVLPRIAALIYKRSCRPPSPGEFGSVMACAPDSSLDWAANVATLLGFESEEHADMFRYYVFLHADHEGGNVSCHTAHLVGSALADPFLAFASSMAGLAGPLHGLANQQCLAFFQGMLAHLRDRRLEVNDANVEKYIQEEMLGKGQVVPGFGHAALRVEDPRFTAQKMFAEERGLTDELLEVLRCCVRVAPKLLRATGKVASPYPNVDAHSGAILHHYGLHETSFYTVLFGLSRSLGVAAQLVWDRILGLPIERPKSMSLDALKKKVAARG